MLQTSIAQTDLLFSQYLSDMGSYCQELYYSDAVRKIRVSDELTQAERVHVAQEIQKGLQQHQQLHSVYVINHNGNCFFHITNSSLFLENLESVLPKKLSEQNMSLFPFVWTVNSRYENAAAVSLLSMYMQAASFADPFYTGSVVVNCDLTQLTSVLFPSEKGDENPQFYIVDFQGHLIIDSGRQGYGQDLSLGMDVSRILSGENEFQHTLPDGTRQVVLSSASHYPGFYIAAVIPVQSPQAKVAAALLTLPVAVLFVCALCMYVSYMVGRKMFAPLGSLVSTIQQNEPAVTMENDSGDELQYLQRYYQHVSAFPLSSERDYYVNGKDRDIHDIIVRNIRASTRQTIVALRNTDGAKLYRITIENVFDEPSEYTPWGVVKIGENNYYCKRASILGETREITVRNVHSQGAGCIFLGGSLQDCHISDVFASGGTMHAVSSFLPEMVFQENNCSIFGGVDMKNVLIENVFYSGTAAYCNDPGDGSYRNRYTYPGLPFAGCALDFRCMRTSDRFDNVRFRNIIADTSEKKLLTHERYDVDIDA